MVGQRSDVFLSSTVISFSEKSDSPSGPLLLRERTTVSGEGTDRTLGLEKHPDLSRHGTWQSHRPSRHDSRDSFSDQGRYVFLLTLIRDNTRWSVVPSVLGVLSPDLFSRNPPLVLT